MSPEQRAKALEAFAQRNSLTLEETQEYPQEVDDWLACWELATQATSTAAQVPKALPNMVDRLRYFADVVADVCDCDLNQVADMLERLASPSAAQVPKEVEATLVYSKKGQIVDVDVFGIEAAFAANPPQGESSEAIDLLDALRESPNSGSWSEPSPEIVAVLPDGSKAANVYEAFKCGVASQRSFKCAARPNGSSQIGANDPQECDWPTCGCDPYADKVIAALRGESSEGWISVNDRLPAFHVPVWLCEEGRMFIGARCDESDGWLWGHCYDSQYLDNGVWRSDCIEADDDYQPTHWMALPSPPPSQKADAPSQEPQV